VVGDLDRPSALAPVVIAHGGPGATHDYLEPLAVLGESGRVCVLYDQVGCGRSSHHRDVPPGFWTVELFLRELEGLIDHLGLDRYHLLGQSWGAMLGLEHAFRRPAGLRSLVLANGTASVSRYVEANAELLRGLPGDAGDALVRHGRAGTTSDPEFQSAIKLYSRRHRLRLDDTPEPLRCTQQAIEADDTVYAATIGSEFHITGTLLGWDVTRRLGEIDVPTLIITGGYDELPPSLAVDMQRGIRGSELVVFEDASHMTHLEEPERFIEVVQQFLTSCELDPKQGEAMTTTVPTVSTATLPGVALINALRRGDLDGVRGLLAADVHVRGLLPTQTMEADDRETAVALFAEGFVNEAMERLEVVATDRIGGRDFVAYRAQWSTPEDGRNVFEQHAFYDTDSEGRISWMHVLCSGNHPVNGA
jgi:L-proline amide hydrolase